MWFLYTSRDDVLLVLIAFNAKRLAALFLREGTQSNSYYLFLKDEQIYQHVKGRCRTRTIAISNLLHTNLQVCA